MAELSAFAQEGGESPWAFNGAIQGDYQYLDYDPNRKGMLEFDTLIGEITYDDGAIIGSGRMRYYRYSHRLTGGSDSGELAFLQYFWVGYRFVDKSELTVGLSSQPFGLYPYVGDNYYESIAFYAGFEDTQSLGVKYSRKDGDLETQLAYYPSDGGHGWANTSDGNYLERDAARYSFHAVNGNEERDTAIVRATYSFEHSERVKSEIGISYLNGKIDSSINQDGRRNAVAAHYAGSFGKLGIKLEAIQYQYQLHGSPTTILIGAFGYSNKFATEGDIYLSNISYALDGSIGPFSGFTIYNSYGVLSKSAAGFKDSSQNVTGVSFGAGKVFVYADYMRGKNSTYMSPVFYNGMGSGASTNSTGHRININVGYYF